MAWFSSAGRADLRRKAAETVRDFLLAGRLRNCVNRAMVETPGRERADRRAASPRAMRMTRRYSCTSRPAFRISAPAAVTGGSGWGGVHGREASKARLAAGHLGQEIEEVRLRGELMRQSTGTLWKPHWGPPGRR